MNAPPESAVVARDVQFQYRERMALQGLSFAVAAGGIHAFLGPNGSGKSTLFKILSTAYPLQQGSVQVFGRDLSNDRNWLRSQIGVVFQSPALDRKLTVRENLTYAGRIFGMSGRELAHRVDDLLGTAGLMERSKDPVGELSGGLKRRVELAKGLLHRPRIVLLDEPTAGLDPGARTDLWRLLQSIPDLTVLFTTHMMEEAEIAAAVTILHEGRIVADGSPAVLKSELGDALLEITTGQAEAVATALAKDLSVKALVLGRTVRIQHPDAGAMVQPILSVCGTAIERISVGPPSLEDVFIQRTGHRFWGDV